MAVYNEEYSWIPTWDQVKNNYPYKPKGPTEERKAELTELRRNREDRALQKSFEKTAKENDELWNPPLLTDRSQLPNRNAWWDVVSHVQKPQNKKQFAEAWAHDMMEEIASWFPWGSKDSDAADPLEYTPEFLAWKNGGGAGGGAYDPLAGTPFPSIGGYSPDWKTLREAANIEAPQYHERAFNPMNTVANMLMNMDWINMDMSRAGKIMQDAFNRRADDNANVANKNEEAKYNVARDKLNTALAFEELRAKAAQQAAQIAIARWNAMQPKALGGNKMFWRDSKGGLHFEAIDKYGEARTLGSNEAMADLMSMDANKIRKMTPKQIAQLAERKALMLGENAAQVPFRQGYILMANQLKAGEK